MKFEINNSPREIDFVNDAEMLKEMGNEHTLGCTIYKTQKILILETQANPIKTLKHELTHAWMYEYAHSQDDKTLYGAEDICEIVSSSNDFINEVINKCTKKGVK